ncbi:helix-turn-helix domain-containing protein [Streptantibioticus silvisoli]|uniref:Helix-turn-helix transcriptional regulator n=1 Tax=Streptantibioticus silvisoli TaxID=2705255 RepID=A0ABT6VY65_9ACTN|nr:helix-turn-helix transcriptional regulator [Streptantibioticus silvisoli]MDI5963432.1 helix-turn-helix transcriptional regulator [Streptantibioticus silvisoli]
MSTDLLWSTRQVRTFVDCRDPGGLIRIGRQVRGWRQADLGARIGCSASTISRLEQHGRQADLALLRHAAREVGVPTNVLAASLGLGVPPATTVAREESRRAEEDPMRRRTLLAATGLTVPAALLSSMQDALASMPDPTGSHLPVDVRLATARQHFDAGHNTRLLQLLPGLLADAQYAARSRHETALASLSATYSLASQILTKIGRYDQSRLAADRATVYAELSGSPLVAAAAARELSIVLRHQNQPAAAQRHILDAVARMEATGLRTDAQASAYAQMLCTTSYTAAVAGDRDQALAMIHEATRAARGLPDEAPTGRLFPLTPAAVDLYAVGVHWALGDAGTALETGRRLHEDQFRTAERKGRMHTDLGRAWWQRGKPEQTAAELLAAARVSPSEVRDRPTIRQIVTDLHSRHPRTPGVRELVAVTRVAV